MYRITIALFLSFHFFSAMSQTDWNWPEDQAMFNKAQEKQAYYKVCMQLDNYEEAFRSLNWLYENNAELNPSIYIEGAKVIEKLLEKELPKDRMTRLEDSLLWMFDQRIRYFGDEASVLDRKAYTAFKVQYRSPEKYASLTETFEKAFALNGSNISTFNLSPYMTLAKFYHQSKPDQMSAERVLDIHDKITGVIDEKIRKGEDAEKLKKDQDKVDALLSSIDGILSCTFINEKLAPKLQNDPKNVGLAKKIFTYSIRAKCTDSKAFTDAAAIVYEVEPNAKLATALGNKYLAADELEKAIEYFQKATELTQVADDNAEALMGMALAYTKLSNKPKARQHAYEVLALKPADKAAYNLIGNLYFTSYENCKQGESKVNDRLVFIAAYEKYKLAGNKEQMAASQAQFPSIEEIFTEGLEEGKKLTCNCWVNETVVLQRRN